MGHFDYEEYLERENIDLYLNALAEEIIERGIGEHSILIVGGAVTQLQCKRKSDAGKFCQIIRR